MDFEVVRRVVARQLAMTQGHFPGYRIYFTIYKNVVVVLLLEGDKKLSRQILLGQKMAKTLPDDLGV